MSSSLHLTRRIQAELLNYPGRCIALDADGECLVCWKAPDFEAQFLIAPDVGISARLEYVEWESLGPLGPLGDALYLHCHTADRTYSGLARLENKQLVEYLTRQSTLNIVIFDHRLTIVGEKLLEWDGRKRDEARKLLDRLLGHITDDPLRYHEFLRRDPKLRVAYTRD